jgi:hypothetical protein
MSWTAWLNTSAIKSWIAVIDNRQDNFRMNTQSMYSTSCLTIKQENHINIQYTYVVGKYNIYLYEF